MAFKQVVMLKGQKDGIDIILDADVDFVDIQNSLRRKVVQGRRFFDGADTKVTFKGRTLDELSEKILIDIITEETNLDITFVQAENYPSRGAIGTANMYPSLPHRHGHREIITVYHHGNLRSGQSIRYRGSVVVLGDVNPGSEIIAEGNVIILGALKGMAHAGANGDSNCFISALHLQPTQLRIAGFISYVPDSIRNSRSAAAYAYIKDGQVFISPL